MQPATVMIKPQVKEITQEIQLLYNTTNTLNVDDVDNAILYCNMHSVAPPSLDYPRVESTQHVLCYKYSLARSHLGESFNTNIDIKKKIKDNFYRMFKDN